MSRLMRGQGLLVLLFIPGMFPSGPQGFPCVTGVCLSFTSSVMHKNLYSVRITNTVGSDSFKFS